MILRPGLLLGPSLRVKVFGPGTHNAPLFPTREGSLPRLEKENVCDWLGMGNSGPLMLVCSNVRITEEFSIFGVTFDAVVWDSLEA